ncbi:DUF4254 domain-containing protein [Nocardia sp. CS682]|uniref:DUF4254 domain-containing protein n=1 Tax=Nocardia sp. CS682 TaxID=1047172 RepID=UPI0010758078|nr:DUF4254 domain-containing protein [Nocardia sp. CS682]QBS41329.1 hypothetical protein DMB37_15560 [Nocardia sp. CS682]
MNNTCPDPYPLPGKDLLLAACRGMPMLDPTHPMLDAAAELAKVHETREVTATCDGVKLALRRMELIRVIDEWIAQVAPPPFPAATLHTETVGQIVDRLAQLTNQTFIALAHAPADLYQDSWARLWDLASGYQDLIDELHNRTRRLPSTFLDLW